MRVLSRRGGIRPAPDGLPPPGTGEEAQMSASPNGAGASEAGSPGAEGRSAAPEQSAQGSAVSERPVVPERPASRRVDAERLALIRLRRRRLFVLFAAVPVSIGLAAVLGGMWIVAQLLVDAGLVAYIVHLRRARQAERRLAASRAARDRRIAAERAARGAGRPPAAAGAGPASASAAATHAGSGRTEGRWTAEYEPIRLSDHPERLSEEELAAAAAETVDLGTLMAGAGGQAGGSTEAAAAEAAAAEAAVAEVGVAEVGASSAGFEAESGFESGFESGGYGDPGMAASAEAIHEAGGGAEAGAGLGPSGNVRVAAGRAAARPGARPTTSKPGRVQVSPPGTHGGLTAPPGSGSAAGAAPGSPSPAAASAAGDGRDGFEELLRRRAVNG
jgi:hypothetical protein